jgi:hypothetical protein
MKKVMFEKKQRSRRSSSNRHQSLVDRERLPNELPQLQPMLSVGTTLRFVTTGIGGTSVAGVTFNNLLDAWLIAGTSTTGYQLFDFVKIKRVTVRAVGSRDLDVSTGPAGMCTVGVEFPGLVPGTSGGGKTVSGANMGTANCAYVSARPEKWSLAACYQPSNNNTAFVVRAVNQDGSPVIGAVIDVELAYKNNPDVNPVSITSAISGATAGNLYYGGIDGARLAATWARSAFTPRI